MSHSLKARKLYAVSVNGSFLRTLCWGAFDYNLVFYCGRQCQSVCIPQPPREECGVRFLALIVSFDGTQCTVELFDGLHMEPLGPSHVATEQRECWQCVLFCKMESLLVLIPMTATHMHVSLLPSVSTVCFSSLAANSRARNNIVPQLPGRPRP